MPYPHDNLYGIGPPGVYHDMQDECQDYCYQPSLYENKSLGKHRAALQKRTDSRPNIVNPLEGFTDENGNYPPLDINHLCVMLCIILIIVCVVTCITVQQICQQNKIIISLLLSLSKKST